MTKTEEKICFVEETLNFYFKGDFREAVTKGRFDLEEIDSWSNIATLFEYAVSGSSWPSEEDYENILSLLEDLYVSAQVDIAMYGSLDKLDPEEVGLGYDFDRVRYTIILKEAFDRLNKEGLDLFDSMTKSKT